MGINLSLKKYILLGDLHFGAKKFSLDFLANQIKFFDKQLIPYMLEHSISDIIQVGDIFDNRTVMDINFLNVLRKSFFDKLLQNNISFTCITGNHDIYFKNTREANLLSLVQELYPNVTVFNEQTKIIINNIEVGMIPFLVTNETMNEDILNSVSYIFGHLEVAGFEIANGVIDSHSSITQSTFSTYKNIKTVFSGHYHIKNTAGFVKYLGIPYNMTWSDYGNRTGFHVLNEDFSIKFIENIVSDVYTKILYDGTILLDNTEVTLQNIEDTITKLKNKVIKIYLYNMSPDDMSYEALTNLLNLNNIRFSLVDNRDTLTEASEDITENTKTSILIKSTDVFINDYIKEHYQDLYPLFLELLGEPV